MERLRHRLLKTFDLRPGELAPALESALLFYLVLSAYYVLRPLREEMGLAAGIENLPAMYMGTLAGTVLLVPAVGWLVRRHRREVFLPLVYRFFALNLLGFQLAWRLCDPEQVVALGRVFYVWLSVFNMLAVSLFWSFMADGFGYRRSRRLFGLVAIGGTAGAILGSGLTAALIDRIGHGWLMVISAVLLEAGVRTVGRLARRFDAAGFREGDPPATDVAGRGRGLLAGLTLTFTSPYLLAVAAYLFLYSLTSTFLYFQQAHIVDAQALTREGKAALFARIDLWTNLLTLTCELLLTGRLLKGLGTGRVLALMPAGTAIGFAALAAAPGLVTLVVFQVARRAANYALARPARETLFTTVDDDVRYRAKSFIDTFVYRGGDLIGAGTVKALGVAGLGLAPLALVAAPLAVLWTWLALYLGRRQQVRAAAGLTGEPGAPAS
ncbi:MFS transporter [bacterium]|nr:MFS transporter [bacterium]